MPEWMEGDQDLLRHALELEEKIKQKAVDEELERRHALVANEVMGQVQSAITKYLCQPLIPLTVEHVQAEVRQYIHGFEMQNNIPEHQRIAYKIRVEQDPDDPSSINVLLPQKIEYLTLDLTLGGAVVGEGGEAAAGQGVEEDER